MVDQCDGAEPQVSLALPHGYIKNEFESRHVPILAALETHIHQQLSELNMNEGKHSFRTQADKHKSHFKCHNSIGMVVILGLQQSNHHSQISIEMCAYEKILSFSLLTDHFKP